MNQLAKFTVVAALGIAGAACSQSTPPAAPPADSAPPASAIPLHAPAAASADTEVAPPAAGPTLYQDLQRPAFASALDAMDGASALPAWAKHGGVAAPSRRVEVDGKRQWLAQVCETQACDTGELLVLSDPAAHTLQGLLVQASGDAAASVRQLHWLGKPDAATQAFLQAQTRHE